MISNNDIENNYLDVLFFYLIILLNKIEIIILKVYLLIIL